VLSDLIYYGNVMTDMSAVQAPDQLASLLAILDISRTDNDFRPLSETMELICQRIVRLLPYNWVTISLLSPDKEETIAWGDPEIKPEFLAWSRTKRPSRKSSYSPVFLAISSGHPITITDIQSRPDLSILKEGAAIQGFRAAVYVPIVARGRVLGTLNCYTRDPHIYSESEYDLLRAVARLVGITVETALIAERHRATALEIQQLSEELTHRNEELSRLMIAQLELAELLMDAGLDPLQAICSFLARLFGVSVMVYSSAKKSRAQAGDNDVLVALEQFLARRDLSKLPNVQNETNVNNFRMFRIGRNPLLGWLLVQTPAGGWQEQHGFLLRHATALIGFEMETERAERTVRDLARPSVLLAIAKGQPSEPQIGELASVLELGAVAARVAFVATGTDRDASLVARRINRAARTCTGVVVAVAEREGVIVLLGVNELACVTSELKALLNDGSDVRWSAGLSGPLRSLSSLPEAVRHARALAKAAPLGTVASFDELGPASGLLRHIPSDSSAAFVSDFLGPLIAYDRARGTELVDSVAAYIRHKGSLSKAAKELRIHPNTLQLRLTRVSQVLRVDMHDPEILGLLGVAIKWHRLSFRPDSATQPF